MGWPTGLEPANAGATTRCVNQLRHDRHLPVHYKTIKIESKHLSSLLTRISQAMLKNII